MLTQIAGHKTKLITRIYPPVYVTVTKRDRDWTMCTFLNKLVDEKCRA